MEQQTSQSRDAGIVFIVRFLPALLLRAAIFLSAFLTLRYSHALAGGHFLAETLQLWCCVCVCVCVCGLSL